MSYYDQNLVNLRDRDNLQTMDNRPVPKVSFVWKFDCNPFVSKLIRSLYKFTNYDQDLYNMHNTVYF